MPAELKIKNPSFEIVVSHSGKQYVHQLLYALYKRNFNFLFFTSFWYKPDKFPFSIVKFFPIRLRLKLEKELKKRYFDKIPNNKVIQFPFFELLRELLDKFISSSKSEYVLYLRDRIHDSWVSKKIKKEHSIVIGYEECSWNTFEKAKRFNKTTILDLAQIHYNEIKNLSKEFPVFGEIYTNQNLRNKIDKIKERELYLSDYIICLSTFAKDSLVKNGIAQDKIFVVNLGFDPDKFKPKTDYIKSEKLKLVFAGTMTKRKGLDVIFKSLKGLSDLVTLTLIGPMSDAIDLFEENKGLFTWYEYLEQEEMNKVFNECDIFIFPSYLDSWAMVVIEAMACGLPVIISENTGAKDAIDGDSGFVIPAGDSISLIEKILFFYNNRNEIERMGTAARKKAELYTWENYHARIGNIINVIQDRT